MLYKRKTTIGGVKYKSLYFKSGTVLHWGDAGRAYERRSLIGLIPGGVRVSGQLFYVGHVAAS